MEIGFNYICASTRSEMFLYLQREIFINSEITRQKAKFTNEFKILQTVAIIPVHTYTGICYIIIGYIYTPLRTSWLHVHYETLTSYGKLA